MRNGTPNAPSGGAGGADRPRNPLPRLGWCHGARGRQGRTPLAYAAARWPTAVLDRPCAPCRAKRRRDEGRPNFLTPSLRPGSNKGLTGKEVAGLLASCHSTPNECKCKFRSGIDHDEAQHQLLLCLYGLPTHHREQRVPFLPRSDRHADEYLVLVSLELRQGFLSEGIEG